MKNVEVHKNTIEQLRSLRDNSESFIVDKNCPDYNPDTDGIWERDVEAIDNAIEIIEAYQELNNRRRK